MKKFLVADDSIFMRIMIKRVLTDIGHTVIGEAENGKEAVEAYKKLRPDMVTMDITMDVMSGLAALREIIAFDPKALVIMVSAMGQEVYIKEAIRSGAKGFLVKPFHKEIVESTIKRLL